MMFPTAISRLAVVVALCSSAYLLQKAGPEDGGLSEPPEAAAQQQTAGITVRPKPGFDADRPSVAEIELIGKFLPEILNGMNSGKKQSGS